MQRKPLVSVIMIFFNEEKFIQQSVESVLSQTYENWELIFVDDGSSDTSSEIARQYASQLPSKIKYIEHQNHINLGMSASRNIGIKYSKGEYISFLDADDVWYPYTMKEQVEILEANSDAEMVFGLLQIWSSWSGNTNKQDEEKSYPDELTNLLKIKRIIDSPILLKFMINKLSFSPGICVIMMRRELFDSIGGFFELFQGFPEDQVIYVKVFLEHKVYISDRCWARYRQHSGSCVTKTKQIGAQQYLRLVFLHWIEQYLKEKHFRDNDIWRAIYDKMALIQTKLIDREQQSMDKEKILEEKINSTTSVLLKMKEDLSDQ